MQKYILGLLIVFGGGLFWAKAQERKETGKRAVEKLYTVHFGKDTASYTFLKKDQFDSITQLPLYLKDDKGVLLPVEAFDLLYSEWGLFEDNRGKEMIMTEYYRVSVQGSQIPDYFQKDMMSMAKPGDTLTVYGVWAANKDSTGKITMVKETLPKKLIISE